MKVETVALESLKPYQNNPRHNDEAVEVVAKSIAEFGFQVPIVVDSNNVIVAGHTRWHAAKRLGLETVPVVIANNLDEAKAAAYRIMDNKAAEKSKWDFGKLSKEFENLDGVDFDIEAVGFDLFEIEKIKLDFPASVADVSGQPEDAHTPLQSPSNGLPSNPYALDDDHVPVSTEKPKPQELIQYTIIFNNSAEQEIWTEYLKTLKEQFPEAITVSERIILDIQTNK